MHKNHSITDGHSSCFQTMFYVMINNYLIPILGYLFVYSGVFISVCWIPLSGIAVVKVYSFKIFIRYFQLNF